MKHKKFDFTFEINEDENNDDKIDYPVESFETEIVYSCILFIEKIKNQQNSVGSDLFNKIQSTDLQDFIYKCINF